MTESTGTVGARPILEVEGVRTEFRLRNSTVAAVDDISFSVMAGECVGLVGESGCGKSTTGMSIMKLLPPIGHVTSGSIRLDGRDLVPLSEHAMRDVRGNEVSMIFQDPMTSLNPTWRIGRQIAESVRLHRGASKEEAMARALEVLRLVGMPRPEERLAAYPHQLSGGLRQRVMIAMALACEPKLLIADEPTTALDVTIQAQILDLLDELRERLGMAVVLITHDMGVIAARASRVMVMYAGRIVESAPTVELFERTDHPYAEALLRSIPRLDQDRNEPLLSIPGLPPDLAQPISHCRFAPRCRYATDECRIDDPVLAVAGGLPSPKVDADSPPSGDGIGSPLDHRYACFHPVSTAPSAPPVELALSVSDPEAREAALVGRAPILTLTGVSKRYSIAQGVFGRRRGPELQAVTDVSFSIREGETFGLVGESGCGKTTIGRMIVALERPSEGSIVFGTSDITTERGSGLRNLRRDLQLMFQDPYASLDPRMRVGTILREPLAIQHEGDRDSQRTRVRELLGEVGLSPSAAGLYPHEFSGGQRQRIGLARAIALSPKLIVADEPVSALDVSIQAQILNLMRSLQERHGLTYLVISHDLAVVRYVADTIGVMYLGKLVEIGPSSSIYATPAHPYTRGLLDAIPTPDPSSAAGTRLGQIRGELPSAVDPPSGCRFRTRCPYAQEICAEVEPPMRRFGEGHRAACHFPLEAPIDGEPGTLVSSGPSGSSTTRE